MLWRCLTRRCRVDRLPVQVNVGWPKGRLNGHLTASASFIENCNQVASLARVMGDQQQADR